MTQNGEDGQVLLGFRPFVFTTTRRRRKTINGSSFALVSSLFCGPGMFRTIYAPPVMLKCRKTAQLPYIYPWTSAAESGKVDLAGRGKPAA